MWNFSNTNGSVISGIKNFKPFENKYIDINYINDNF